MINDELKDNPYYISGVEETIRVLFEELQTCMIGFCSDCEDYAECARCYAMGENEDDFVEKLKRRLLKC